RIYNYLISTERTKMRNARIESQFVRADRTLDMERILQRFQAHCEEQYSKRSADFLEREWRLLFLAFLKPIINGEGHTFIEPEISEERRLDVVVAYGRHKYVVELKRWYGQEAHERGVLQLSDYLDRQHLKEGYLVIFDARRKEVGEAKWLTVGDKKIFAVWV
ncbi:MAG: hypothetical protein NZ521_08025, partial [Flammeovirgaceae bacterium]|nr:hypothetical protein [Flammeovirgaceae bacterium]